MYKHYIHRDNFEVNGLKLSFSKGSFKAKIKEVESIIPEELYVVNYISSKWVIKSLFFYLLLSCFLLI